MTMDIETTLFLIGEYMNLVHACDEICAEERSNFSERLDTHRETINDYLRRMGYDDAGIEDVWCGEAQLTSS